MEKKIWTKITKLSIANKLKCEESERQSITNSSSELKVFFLKNKNK